MGLSGGLGNQLFQYASGLGIATRLDAVLRLDDSAVRPDERWLPDLLGPHYRAASRLDLARLGQVGGGERAIDKARREAATRDRPRRTTPGAPHAGGARAGSARRLVLRPVAPHRRPARAAPRVVPDRAVLRGRRRRGGRAPPPPRCPPADAPRRRPSPGRDQLPAGRLRTAGLAAPALVLRTRPGADGGSGPRPRVPRVRRRPRVRAPDHAVGGSLRTRHRRVRRGRWRDRAPRARERVRPRGDRELLVRVVGRVARRTAPWAHAGHGPRSRRVPRPLRPAVSCPIAGSS